MQISYTVTKLAREWTRLTNKEFKILSILLLAEKPIPTSEISELAGYHRQTLDPYITKFVVNGYIIDVGRDGSHGWVVSDKHRQELLETVTAFSGAIETKHKEIAHRFNLANEKYEFTWTGKDRAKSLAYSPSRSKLRPCVNESINWNSTKNFFIEGDNLEVLKILTKSYSGKIKMIYIDPPYNSGNSFEYNDNFGDHSQWLNMIYPRLALARSLLREDGVIFISIDDKEVVNLRKICDEIFGEDNFVVNLIWHREGATDNHSDFKINHEYILAYAKNLDMLELGDIIDPNTGEKSNVRNGLAINSVVKTGKRNPVSEITLPVGFPAIIDTIQLDINSPSPEFFSQVKKMSYISKHLASKYGIVQPIRLDEMVVENGYLVKPCKVFSGWANANKLKKFIDNNCLPIEDDNGDTIEFYLKENGAIYYKKQKLHTRNVLSVLRNMGNYPQSKLALEQLGIYFSYPKPVSLLMYLIKLGCTNKDETILDFFAGSASTAHAVLELNKEDNCNHKFIMVQLPEPTYDIVNDIAVPKTGSKDAYEAGFKDIAEIGKERLRRVIARIKEESPEYEGDLGFKVFKLISH